MPVHARLLAAIWRIVLGLTGPAAAQDTVSIKQTARFCAAGAMAGRLAPPPR
jgi:hypothetical protein